MWAWHWPQPMGFHTTNNTCKFRLRQDLPALPSIFKKENNPVGPLESWAVTGHWSTRESTTFTVPWVLINRIWTNPVQSPLSFQAFPKKLTSQ
ncbi:26957b27-2ec5-4a5b-ba51-19289be4e933 [Sclerotinia trifoliorum]|uniref:26957b27-2ec5-4a5b-ba51-19289be4e933 n=1 Tax=Sclerotinia trifoliorum TaxID=28548 RepID=A0A8H2ZT19_9HELO|nr:26957b27-2ec5-4a5b-ba51-19289be4e933 [Sclerotinia trifoliorum]